MLLGGQRMKVINAVGRILLIAAGVMMLAAGIPLMIEAVNYLNTNNVWWNFGDPTARQYMWNLLGHGLNALGAVIALVAALLGRRSGWLALYAIVMMITPVYTVVTGVQNGTLTWDWNKIWPLIVQFAAPLMYFFGCLFVGSGRHD